MVGKKQKAEAQQASAFEKANKIFKRQNGISSELSSKLSLRGLFRPSGLGKRSLFFS